MKKMSGVESVWQLEDVKDGAKFITSLKQALTNSAAYKCMKGGIKGSHDRHSNNNQKRRSIAGVGKEVTAAAA
jgi:hypothetical protein